jgi:hypothetical protein
VSLFYLGESREEAEAVLAEKRGEQLNAVNIDKGKNDWSWKCPNCSNGNFTPGDGNEGGVGECNCCHEKFNIVVRDNKTMEKRVNCLYQENESKIDFWCRHENMTECIDCWTNRRPNEHVQRWTPESEQPEAQRFEPGQTVWVWDDVQQDVLSSEIVLIDDYHGISTTKSGFYAPKHVFPTAAEAYEYAATRWAEAEMSLYWASCVKKGYHLHSFKCRSPLIFNGVRGQEHVAELAENKLLITPSLTRALAWIEEQMKKETPD